MNIGLKVDKFLNEYQYHNRDIVLKFTRQGIWTQYYAYFLVEVVQRGFYEDWHPEPEIEILDDFHKKFKIHITEAQIRYNPSLEEFEIENYDNSEFHKRHEDVLEEIAMRYSYCMFFPGRKAKWC